MDIPSRRTRKKTRSSWSICCFIIAICLLLALCFLAYVAIQTGNYMGLAAIFVLVFFFLLGLNVGNIRRLTPGLSSDSKTIQSAAVFIYTCLGFVALTMASHLPKSQQYLALEINEMPIAQQKPSISQEESPSVTVENKPIPNLATEAVDKANSDLPKPQEQKIEQTAPVSKMEPAAEHNVVTKVIDAHLIQINNQQLIRLIGIQVPDSMQNRATARLEELLKNQQVALTICTERPQDEYGRTRAVVTANGVNVNQKLIEDGYSPLVITAPSSIDFTSWKSIENVAKKQKKGIWAKHPD